MEPLTAVATAARQLFHNPAPHVADAWLLRRAALETIIWSVAIIALCAPLAVRRYRRMAG